MALATTDVQGVKIYIAADGTDVSTAGAVTTAIAGADQIGCVQSIGEIASTKNVQTYSCLSSDEISKSIGSLQLGNTQISLLFDTADAAGQAALRTMYETNARKVFIIELNDNAGATATTITFNGAISGQAIPLEKDAAVLINSTIEFTSNYDIIDATAV
ncbi:MAG: hypothetical protein U9O83_01970 [Campylobacterota bacterium]|nr:hypothetical protein [Campylobacterota bacterium]